MSVKCPEPIFQANSTIDLVETGLTIIQVKDQKSFTRSWFIHDLRLRVRMRSINRY